MNRWVEVIKYGRTNTTYKMAWARAIIEIIIDEEFVIKQDKVIIDFEDIAYKFLEYYWDQTWQYDFNQGPNSMIVSSIKVLIQDYTKVASVESTLRYSKTNVSKYIPDAVQSTIREITHTLKKTVSVAFLNNKKGKKYNLYQYNLAKEYIELDEGTAKWLVANESELFNIISYRWIQLLIQYNKERIDIRSDFEEIWDHSTDIVSEDSCAYGGMEVRAEIKRRKGQEKLRKILLKEYNTCMLCGMSEQNLLVASHIKPWSKSNNREKVEIENVLLLCPNHDKVFDKGYITFSNQGKLIKSSYLTTEDAVLLGIVEGQVIELEMKSKGYMQWHREHVFQQS